MWSYEGEGICECVDVGEGCVGVVIFGSRW